MRPGPNWIPGEIIQKVGPVTYLVDTHGDRPWKCHIDQLKEFEGDSPTVTQPVPDPIVSEPEIDFSLPQTGGNTQPAESVPVAPAVQDQPSSPSTSPPATQSNAGTEPPERRYPSRQRHRPNYYGF